MVTYVFSTVTVTSKEAVPPDATSASPSSWEIPTVGTKLPGPPRVPDRAPATLL